MHTIESRRQKNFRMTAGQSIGRMTAGQSIGRSSLEVRNRNTYYQQFDKGKSDVRQKAIKNIKKALT